ncbi:MAG: primosomal protein N' [Chloroflexi bacterium]|nr:primosomal protein N' [Chloroflexota bacterium]
MRFAEVAVDTPWTRNRTFTYSIPEHINLELAHSVWVPFGPRRLQGIVFDITDTPSVQETKDIISVIDPSPLLTSAHLALARWISQRYLASLFDSTALMLPPGFRRRVLTEYALDPSRDSSSLVLTPAQSKVVEHLRAQGSSELRSIKRAVGVGAASAADQLVRRGILTREWRWARPMVGPKFLSTVRLVVSKEEASVLLHANAIRKNAVQQVRLVEALIECDGPVPVPELRERGVGPVAVRALEARGLVVIDRVRVYRDPLGSRQYQATRPHDLTEAQTRAWDSISEAMDRVADPSIRREGPAVFLLRGVTGSGKTELYLWALEKAVAQGRRGLVLVPEISLTPQTIQRFSGRFPGRVAVLHSRLSPGEQFDEWWRIKEGEFDVVIGSRSALFAPQPDLGLIVLDEEHDSSYKQTEPPPRYHARDVAIELARLTRSVVILGSATPDLSSFHRATRDEFQLLELPARIALNGDGAPSGQSSLAWEDSHDTRLPGVKVVDMRGELREGNRSIFSRALSEAMSRALDSKEQVILFMNRRGSATFVQCRECGFVLKCRRCDVSLTYHSTRENLICHHCGFRAPTPRACPECGGSRMSYLGTGTQRVEEEVLRGFPGARVLRWDTDVIKGKVSHEEILDKFLARQADVLIGTQMIAKGLHIPAVTLVGVISADVGLNFPDFRAGERAFQVLTQVAGRAGRGPLGGRVIVQTFNPNHYVIEAASRHDYTGFYQQEIRYRRQNRYPPFSRLARLVYSHANAARAETETYRMATRLRAKRAESGAPETDILGPVPCFVRRVRGRYRWQIVVRAPTPETFLQDIAIPEGWMLDIDPIALL